MLVRSAWLSAVSCLVLGLLSNFELGCSPSASSAGAAGAGAAAGFAASSGGQPASSNGGASAGAGIGVAGGSSAGSAGLAGTLNTAGAGNTPRTGWNNVVVGGGGFIDGIVFHPAEAGLAYLRTDIGGAYRFDATHSSWLPITDGIGRAQVDSYGVLSLAIDPKDKERVYLMTGKYTASWAGKGALLASKDRGATWTRAELNFKVGGNEDGRGTGERLQVDPNLGNQLLMGSTHDGLWKSTDYGASWTRVTSFTPTSVNFVLFDPSSGSAGQATPRLFVATASTTDSLWQSSDGGSTWSVVPGQPTGTMAIRAAFAGSSLLVSYANTAGPNDATSGSLQLLDTASLGWSALPVPTGSYGFGGVSVDSKDPKRLIVSTLDRWAPHDEIYQSKDGGKTFAPLLDGATWDRHSAPYTSASTPHWLNDAALDPFNPDRALFVTGYGLWSCTGLLDAHVTCSFEDAGIEETVAAEVIAPPSGAPLLSAMGDIDGFKHDQLDVSPPSRLSPQVGTTLSIAFAEAAPMKMVKAYNKSPFGALSNDGGATWQAFAAFPAAATAGGTQAIAISADGSRVVWSPTGSAPSWSSDQGKTWTACSGLSAGLRAIADRVNPNKFYALDGALGRVLVSADGGASFTAGASDLGTLPDYQVSDASLAAVFAHEGHLWLTLGGHGLFRSTDGGKTFSHLSGPSEAYAVGFGKAKASTGYPALYVWATISNSTGVFRSDDEGMSFVEVTDPQHKFGTIHSITGDRNVYGRVFVGTEGRGVQYFSP